MAQHPYGVKCFCDDLRFERLGVPAEAVAQGVDGSLFCAGGGKLRKREPGAENFQIACDMGEGSYAIMLAMDHAQNIYYIGRGDADVKISRDYGRSFSSCLCNRGHDGRFRGFAVDNAGAVYTGTYSNTGPATLFRSADDGFTWEALLTLRCRHIHDVAVNPHNNWIYVVTGERQAEQYREAYGIFRSRDNGRTWRQIVRPQITKENGWGRPLYLGIGFLGDVVVLSTDHAEGRNGIDIFTDTGENTLFVPLRVFDNPPQTHTEGKAPGYCWRFITRHGRLYTWCANPSGPSLLFRSHNAVDWETCAEFSDCTGRQPEFDPWSDQVLFSGEESGWLMTDAAKPKAEAPALAEELWPAALAAHDQRYEKGFCGGYYFVSLQKHWRTREALRILEEADLPRDALIADVGCGVGPLLLLARARGYVQVVGVEANPRWLVGLRRLYERIWPGTAPTLRLVPRGSFSLPALERPYDAIFIMGVFTGNGNRVPVDQAMELSLRRLREGGFLCFNIDPATYEQNSPDMFLAMLAQRGFGSIRCHRKNREFIVSARKL